MRPEQGSVPTGTLPDSKLQRRPTAYSALAAAGACTVAVAPQAKASIVYSGSVNIAVPATSSGDYINTVTFTVGTTYASVNGGDATAPVIHFWGTSAARVVLPDFLRP